MWKNKVDEFNTYFADVGKSTYQRTQHSLHGDNPRPPHHPPDAPTAATDLFRRQPVHTDTGILTIKYLNGTDSAGSFVRNGLYVLLDFYLTFMLIFLNGSFHHTHDFQRPHTETDTTSTTIANDYVKKWLICHSTHKNTFENHCTKLRKPLYHCQ